MMVVAASEVTLVKTIRISAQSQTSSQPHGINARDQLP
jgi:hypothetical protein